MNNKEALEVLLNNYKSGNWNASSKNTARMKWQSNSRGLWNLVPGNTTHG